MKEERWAVKLAPQLTGKAQQAYAAMKVEDAGTYRLLKEAILRQYDISEETYRQRFTVDNVIIDPIFFLLFAPVYCSNIMSK